MYSINKLKLGSGAYKNGPFGVQPKRFFPYYSVFQINEKFSVSSKYKDLQSYPVRLLFPFLFFIFCYIFFEVLQSCHIQRVISPISTTFYKINIKRKTVFFIRFNNIH